MTPASNVYARLSVIITDTTYCKLSDEDIEYIFEKFLESALVMFREFYKKYNPTLVKNDFDETYIKKNNDEDLDLEEEEILAYAMLLKWHYSQIMRDQYLKQNMNTKDFNRLSNATMLANNITLHKDVLEKEFLKKRRRYRNRDWNGDGL